MARFQYTARSKEGNLLEGSIDAPDRSAAIFQVEQEIGFPIKIVASAETAAKKNEVKAAGGANGSAAKTLRLSHTHQFLFTEQLAHLLGAGMTLDEALAIMERRMQQPSLKLLASILHRSLVDGRSLSQSLTPFPRIFSPLYINMVAAGEASGALPEILRRLTVHLSDVKALRDRVTQALVYPAVLVAAGILLILVFMTIMVPQLTGFFGSTGQTLPLPTRILLGANDVLMGYWWLMALTCFGAFSLFKVLTRSPEGRRAWDRFQLRIPGYGRLIRYRYYAQFARTLGTLIENGLTLLQALDLLEEISGNEHIRLQMSEVRHRVIDGVSLSAALQSRDIFPELFVDMLAVGEQTGRFGETMLMIADVYERELDKQVKIISALIPPVIMVAIATIVGLVVFGILSAVFNLTAGLRSRVT